MKKKNFTNEQIGYALRQAEAGKTVAEICRELGISQRLHVLLSREGWQAGS